MEREALKPRPAKWEPDERSERYVFNVDMFLWTAVFPGRAFLVSVTTGQADSGHVHTLALIKPPG